MTSKEIEERLAKYRKSLDNSKLSEADKDRIRIQIQNWEQKLAEAQAEEEAAEKEKAEAKAAEPKKAASGKKKVTKENKPQVVADCGELVGTLKKVLDNYEPKRQQKKATTPPKVKRVSTVVADGISGTVERVIRKMVKKETIGKVNIGSLREARDRFVAAIKSLRSAFGGASGDQDSFISAFVTRMNELIEELETKQKEAKKETAEA
jgi:hypothetical protein